MTALSLKKLGVFAFHDSGAPVNCESYTTLVIVHGFAWHSGVFARLLPLTAKHNARIVLVNRRDYPHSDPYEETDLQLLNSGKLEDVDSYMRARGRELCDFLSIFVGKESVKEKSLIIMGWSFGNAWMLSLLGNGSSVSPQRVDLERYIKRVILYDSPCHTLGYTAPSDFYNPLFDPSHPPGEGAKLFPVWVSGYFAHGDSASTLEQRNPLEEPKPTLLGMSKEDVASALYPQPAAPGGSDDLLLGNGIKTGLFKVLKERTLYPTDDKWKDVEVKHLWCDRSGWEMPWGYWELQKELDESKKAGQKQTRKLSFLRLRGANHFAHWDEPERALEAFLSDRDGEM